MAEFYVDDVRSVLPGKIKDGMSSFLVSGAPRGVAYGHQDELAFYGNRGAYNFMALAEADTVEILSTGENYTMTGGSLVESDAGGGGGAGTVQSVNDVLPDGSGDVNLGEIQDAAETTNLVVDSNSLRFTPDVLGFSGTPGSAPEISTTNLGMNIRGNNVASVSSQNSDASQWFEIFSGFGIQGMLGGTNFPLILGFANAGNTPSFITGFNPKFGVEIDGTLRFYDYPETRDDGATWRGLYVNSIGHLQHGAIVPFRMASLADPRNVIMDALSDGFEFKSGNVNANLPFIKTEDDTVNDRENIRIGGSGKPTRELTIGGGLGSNKWLTVATGAVGVTTGKESFISLSPGSTLRLLTDDMTSKAVFFITAATDVGGTPITILGEGGELINGSASVNWDSGTPNGWFISDGSRWIYHKSAH